MSEVHLLIRQSGFRPKQTMLDLKRLKKRSNHLPRRRKSIFKHLKTMQEMIWAKSPQMVRKEIWMHLLAQFAAKLDVDIG